MQLQVCLVSSPAPFAVTLVNPVAHIFEFAGVSSWFDASQDVHEIQQSLRLPCEDLQHAVVWHIQSPAP
jgi:hypothetical protein